MKRRGIEIIMGRAYGLVDNWARDASGVWTNGFREHSIAVFGWTQNGLSLIPETLAECDDEITRANEWIAYVEREIHDRIGALGLHDELRRAQMWLQEANKRRNEIARVAA